VTALGGVCAYESGCLVKAVLWWIATLLAVVPAGGATAQQTRIVINLSEQRVYLMEDGRVSLVAPIASGKPGWSTPTGHFTIFSKDLDHRSRSFGLVLDAFGRVVTSNATPASRVPAGGRYRPAAMPFFMEFSPAVGLHAGYLPGYPASHGCVRMPRDLAARFFERVHLGTPVTVVGNARDFTRVRKALPAFL
jgi:lipoprotein-anchoring transpeptidase ErfK/SrfK